MIAKRYIPSALNEDGSYVDTTPVVGFTTRFDKASNKFFERALHAENRSFLYIPADAQGQPLEGVGGIPGAGIDSMNRLLQYQRGDLAVGGGSITNPLTLPGADASRTYDLDHLGNWKKSAYAAIPEPPAPESSSSSDSSFSSEDLPTQNLDLRNHNALNQITRRKVASGGTSAGGGSGGSGGWDIFAYDLNGNLLDDGQRLMAYDSLNRLVQVARKSDGAVIGRYLYDAGNRRVQKVVTNGGLSEDIPNGTSQYCYFAGTWQDTEEFHAPAESLDPPQPYKQFIWGTYIDELTQLTLLQTAGSQELPPGAYYPLQDLLFRTACVTDDAEPASSSSSSSDALIGQIVEAYDYGAYGNTLIFTQYGTGESWWEDDATQANFAANNVLWCGYRLSTNFKLYSNRNRIYSPTIGTFTGRDGLDYIFNMNLYSYAVSSPSKFSDPFGESETLPTTRPNAPLIEVDKATNTLSKTRKRDFKFPCGTLSSQWKLDASKKENFPEDTDASGNPNKVARFMGVIVQFSFTQKPTSSECCCKKFRWKQLYSEGYDPSQEGTVRKWHIDSKPPALYPWYNRDDIRVERETLYDYPGNIKSEKLFFKSHLVCADEGTNDGKIFATVQWGYVIDKRSGSISFSIFPE